MIRLLVALVLVLAVSAGFGPARADVLPDRGDAPGEVDNTVTQRNLDQTVCSPGYSSRARPPAAYTNRVKRQLAAEQGGLRVADYELDHLIPISLGGDPRSVRNLWLQPWSGACGAHAKDRLEYKLWRLVCQRKVGLGEARSAIAEDWTAAYRRWVGPLVCEP